MELSILSLTEGCKGVLSSPLVLQIFDVAKIFIPLTFFIAVLKTFDKGALMKGDDDLDGNLEIGV